MKKQEYEQKVNLLNKWAYNYYVLDNPIATDEEYDKLYHEVLSYEKVHPEDKLPNSPTNRVGDVLLDGFSKAKHLKRMWSMEDILIKVSLLSG